MIDSGAIGNFISRQAALDFGIPTRRKKHPYQLQVVSRDEIKEDNGWVLYKTLAFRMERKGRGELIKFDLVVIKDYQIILGMPWL
jgi:hypothetical protein